ncbi:MAG: FeS cluster assembly protein SufD [Verrucomicrobia subdivision 3 bacterium]|nr:FeS cluster assembly protein SufD [Limisphaerales bacterium]MCS1415005.1 FeS cluster assembly protein SufD [Limisphaerales bacterium]
MPNEVMAFPSSDIDPRQSLFDQLDGRSLGPDWLLPIRKAAAARFADAGFPTVRDEDWRFTNIAPIRDLAFRPVYEAPAVEVLSGVTEQSLLARLDGLQLVFVDGAFVPELSGDRVNGDGVYVSNLKQAFLDDPLYLQEHITRYSQTDQNAFTALNTAYFADGAVIRIGRNTAVERPLHLVFVASGSEEGQTANPRNLIAVESGASVTIAEEYFGLGESATFTNVVTEFVVGANARVEHVKVQDERRHSFHVAGIYAQLGRDCRFRSHSFALGAKLSRNNIRTKLDGEGLECVLNGLYLTKGEQLADHHMVVEHAKPHCESHEYFNGILDEQSRGVFHGRILVQPHAQKTDAKQTNKNLLLSDGATANTKPQLEIYADDVKCTHGATIGQMDEEAIFYLRARGVPLVVARRMLMHAFAGEIVERIEHDAIRERLDGVTWNRLEEWAHGRLDALIL